MFSKTHLFVAFVLTVAAVFLLVQPALAASGYYKVKAFRTVLYDANGAETKVGFWNGTTLLVKSTKMMTISYTTWWGATRTKTVEMGLVDSHAYGGYVVMSDLVAQ
jgi:hypothetical protein